MKKILIVEDEKVLQDVYKLILQKEGYDISVASNGIEGLNMLKRTNADLVLLDIFMPVMDGREFLRNFSKASFPKTHIIVYTNLSDSKSEAEMRELGADNFVLKSSMTPLDLIEIVKKTLKS